MLNGLFRSAPSRRERLGQLDLCLVLRLVSIRALAKRATSSTRSGRWTTRSFDPRPREESDGGHLAEVRAFLMFRSAPSRRERLARRDGEPIVWPFRSAPSRRERPAQRARFLTVDGVSIRALAKRATSSRGSSIASRRRFDPRPREESDFGRRRQDGRVHTVSIRALAKRATRSMARATSSACCFDPRPREESDLGIALTSRPNHPVSIRALAKRATSLL